MDYITYITNMHNPYNYFEFAAYCANNGIPVLSFMEFAKIVQSEVLDKNSVEIKPPELVSVSQVILPQTPPKANMTNVDITVTKPCCGGGKVL